MFDTDPVSRAVLAHSNLPAVTAARARLGEDFAGLIFAVLGLTTLTRDEWLLPSWSHLARVQQAPDQYYLLACTDCMREGRYLRLRLFSDFAQGWPDAPGEHHNAWRRGLRIPGDSARPHGVLRAGQAPLLPLFDRRSADVVLRCFDCGFSALDGAHALGEDAGFLLRSTDVPGFWEYASTSLGRYTQAGGYVYVGGSAVTRDDGYLVPTDKYPARADAYVAQLAPIVAELLEDTGATDLATLRPTLFHTGLQLHREAAPAIVQRAAFETAVAEVRALVNAYDRGGGAAGRAEREAAAEQEAIRTRNAGLRRQLAGMGRTRVVADASPVPPGRVRLMTSVVSLDVRGATIGGLSTVFPTRAEETVAGQTAVLRPEPAPMTQWERDAAARDGALRQAAAVADLGPRIAAATAAPAPTPALPAAPTTSTPTVPPGPRPIELDDSAAGTAKPATSATPARGAFLELD